MGWCGTDDDAIVLEARTLFNGTIVGIERSEERNASMIKACQTEFPGEQEAERKSIPFG